MDHSLKVWESIQKPKQIKAPALGSSKKGTKIPNSDESALIKREVSFLRYSKEKFISPKQSRNKLRIKSSVERFNFLG